jgi:hypothetical protein
MPDHEDGPAEAVVEHLAECTGAKAAIIVDGSADEVIARLTAAGWGVSDRMDYVGGKRIRYITVPGRARAAE